MEMLWEVAGGVYRWDHKNFDTHISNTILLTNEHIRHSQLTELDYEYHKKLIEERLVTYEAKKLAKHEEYKHHKNIHEARTNPLVDPHLLMPKMEAHEH